jgi:hypothetical protein
MYIQGYYSPVTDLMDNAGAGGCLYVSGVPFANPTDADTVVIAAMNETSPFPEMDRKQAILQTDGTVSVTFTTAIIPGTKYYIRVLHRNSIETWSKFTVTFNPVTSYDFTTASTQAYDDGFNLPMKLVDTSPDRWAFFNGDIDQDGAITSLDMTLEENISNLGLFGYYTTDLTGDGASDSLDMTIIENNSNIGVFEAHP